MSASKGVRQRCSDCSTWTRRKGGICIDCAPRSPAQSTARCAICTTPTAAKSGICQLCQRLSSMDPEKAPPLTGGRWVAEAGIVVWRQWTPEECLQRTRQALQLLEAS